MKKLLFLVFISSCGFIFSSNERDRIIQGVVTNLQDCPELSSDFRDHLNDFIIFCDEKGLTIKGRFVGSGIASIFQDLLKKNSINVSGRHNQVQDVNIEDKAARLNTIIDELENIGIECASKAHVQHNVAKAGLHYYNIALKELLEGEFEKAENSSIEWKQLKINYDKWINNTVQRFEVSSVFDEYNGVIEFAPKVRELVKKVEILRDKDSFYNKEILRLSFQKINTGKLSYYEPISVYIAKNSYLETISEKLLQLKISEDLVDMFIYEINRLGLFFLEDFYQNDTAEIQEQYIAERLGDIFQDFFYKDGIMAADFDIVIKQMKDATIMGIDPDVYVEFEDNLDIQFQGCKDKLIDILKIIKKVKSITERLQKLHINKSLESFFIDEINNLSLYLLEYFGSDFVLDKLEEVFENIFNDKISGTDLDEVVKKMSCAYILSPENEQYIKDLEKRYREKQSFLQAPLEKIKIYAEKNKQKLIGLSIPAVFFMFIFLHAKYSK